MSVVIEGVTHRYSDGTVAISHVSLTIGAPGLYAFVGPSGSGKTTLLSMVGLLLQPTEGTVALHGVTTSAMRRNYTTADVGWVFQTTNLLPRRTVLDNAILASLIAGYTYKAARSAAAEAMTCLDIAHLATQPANRLSGGESQRVGIARAVAARPRVLCADEPTGQLDRAAAVRVIEVFRGLVASSGSTILIATHDMFVARACDRAIALRDGEIEAA